MIIAIAQTHPKSTIKENLTDHYEMIEVAAKHSADMIIFPEMSLTSYVRERARDLSFSIDDIRLKKISELAVEKGVHVIAGAPIKVNNELYIGSFVISPDKTNSIYTKQFLHSGEEEFFSSSFDYDPKIRLKDEQISLAICADISNPIHCKNASKKDSTIYAASIFCSKKGIPETFAKMGQYAKTHEMHTLFSNYCGETLSMISGGKSAFWSNDGELVGQLSSTDPGILLVEKLDQKWSGGII